jgi:NAD(P)-dependent dehydrogenase (short-subunit alcohol dehydrogenase family)
MNTFHDRVTLITGAGRGIGRALALALASQGARVGAIDRRGELLDALAKDLDGRPFAPAVADVTDPAAMRDAVASIESKLGPTDLLIANAGLIHETSAVKAWIEPFTTEIRVNLIGVANSFAAVLPGMCQRKSGHLAAISSIASYRGTPPLAGYCASKAGVNALCDAFRVELRPLGIGVTTICPGFIDTHIADHLMPFERPRMLTVEQAAGQVLGAIARRKRFHAFPLRDTWLSWLLPRLPRPLSDWIVGRYHRRLLEYRRRADALTPPRSAGSDTACPGAAGS